MHTGFLAAAAATAALCLAGAAQADVTYHLENVIFADGTTATGSFTTNISGYIGTFDITTVTGAFAGYAYTPTINTNYTPGGTSIAFNRAAYDGGLVLEFAHPLSGAYDPIVAAGSYECPGYTCNAGTERAVSATSGAYLATPEPTAWIMMVLGFGVAGAGLRRRGANPLRA